MIKVIDIDEFWSLDLDVLVPAAMENAIDLRVAKLINSKMNNHMKTKMQQPFLTRRF